jgi:esterase/lipase
LAHERRDDVRALVLLAPALELSRWWVPWVAPGLRVLSPFLPHDWRYFPKPASDIADPTAREAHLSYGKVPLTTVSELALLQAETRQMLRRVAQPTLAIQGRHDHTVPLRTLALLQQELPNLWATAILPSSYHVITVDVEKDRVAEEVLRFLGQALQGRPRPRGRRMRP